MRLPVAAGAEGLIVPLPVAEPRSDHPDDLADALEGAVSGRVRRPLIIGGALTSAALSLAGAAYVAWRLNRPSVSPMVRAAREVARTRPV